MRIDARFPFRVVMAACLLAVGGPSAVRAIPGDGAATTAPAVPDAPGSGAEQAAAAFGMPAGFRVQLFAAEPDVANPVAFSVDERGRVFVCETFRQNRGVTDNRAHDRAWIEADLAARSVDDRIAYHRRLLGATAADYERHEDRVRRLIDTDGDGRADTVDVYSSGYRNLEDGTAAGILARRGDVLLACIPSLYRLEEAATAMPGGDAATKRVLSTGYGVRVAFRGHDLHGLTLGPDGRIYFTVGDRGFRVEHDGVVDEDPATGAVFRCDADGTHLEVFARGLRNPQELAFDDLGNLFTVDNNSDAGDKARLVHVVPGGEWGWNMAFQYLDDRGPWHGEKLWHTACDEQPAWCLPPLAHLGAGPSGLCSYPGTGLTPHFAGRFLLADFRGAAAGSSVRSFRLRPRAGSFEPFDEEETFRDILATDVEVGPDGAVWVSDWVENWDGSGKGRLWRFLPADRDETTVREVQALLAGDWSTLADGRLVELLGHADRRLRLESQWELVRRSATAALASVSGDSDRPLLARVHAVQGLAQRLRHDDADAAAALVAASADAAWELRQVASRGLGDCLASGHGRAGVRAALVTRLADEHLHVVAAAAAALGRLGRREGDEPHACAALVALAGSPQAGDRTVRHAVAVGLAGVASDADLDRLLAHTSEPVRLVACVALRRRASAAVAALLDDPSPRVATEAARAIHDLPLAAALPALAARAASGPADDAFLRRAVSAAEQVGTPEAATALVRLIARADASNDARRLAVEALASWANPPRVNRITGVWLPDAAPRSSDVARRALAPALAELVAAGDAALADDSLRGAILTAGSRLGIDDVAPMLRRRAADRSLPAGARAQAVDALLACGDASLAALAASLLDDAAAEVRMAARRARAAQDPTDAVVPELVAACGGPTLAERQEAVTLLAGISQPAATAAIERLAGDLRSGTLDPGIALEVREAAALRLGATVSGPAAQGTAADSVVDWREVLAGGNPEAGRRVFRSKAEVSCVRCHQAEGQGGEVGPKLDGIAARREPHALLESIVHPNATIAEGYATTVIVTDEGLTVAGIVIAEDDLAVTLRDAEGRERRVATASIDERSSGPSAMPGDLVGKLSRRELRDLLAWLQGLR